MTPKSVRLNGELDLVTILLNVLRVRALRVIGREAKVHFSGPLSFRAKRRKWRFENVCIIFFQNETTISGCAYLAISATFESQEIATLVRNYS